MSTSNDFAAVEEVCIEFIGHNGQPLGGQYFDPEEFTGSRVVALPANTDYVEVALRIGTSWQSVTLIKV